MRIKDPDLHMHPIFLSHPSSSFPLALELLFLFHHPLISRLLIERVIPGGVVSFSKICCSSSVTSQYPSINHRRQHWMRHLTHDPRSSRPPPLALSAKCSIYYVRACV